MNQGTQLVWWIRQLIFTSELLTSGSNMVGGIDEAQKLVLFKNWSLNFLVRMEVYLGESHLITGIRITIFRGLRGLWKILLVELSLKSRADYRRAWITGDSLDIDWRAVHWELNGGRGPLLNILNLCRRYCGFAILPRCQSASRRI